MKLSSWEVVSTETQYSGWELGFTLSSLMVYVVLIGLRFPLNLCDTHVKKDWALFLWWKHVKLQWLGLCHNHGHFRSPSSVCHVCLSLPSSCLLKASFIFRLLSGQLALGPLISHIPPHLIRHFRPDLDTCSIRHGCANNDGHIQTHFTQMSCKHWQFLTVNSSL